MLQLARLYNRKKLKMLKYLLQQNLAMKDLHLVFFKIVLFYQTTRILIKNNQMKMISHKKKTQIQAQTQEPKEWQKKYWILEYCQKMKNYFKMRILNFKTYQPDAPNLLEILQTQEDQSGLQHGWRIKFMSYWNKITREWKK